MICFPLGRPDSATYRNVIRQLRKLGVRITMPHKLSKVILLADGSPDDIVTTIIAHRLNGRKVVGISKPEYLREDVVRAVKTYASSAMWPRRSQSS